MDILQKVRGTKDSPFSRLTEVGGLPPPFQLRPYSPALNNEILVKILEYIPGTITSQYILYLSKKYLSYALGNVISVQPEASFQIPLEGSSFPLPSLWVENYTIQIELCDHKIIPHSATTSSQAPSLHYSTIKKGTRPIICYFCSRSCYYSLCHELPCSMGVYISYSISLGIWTIDEWKCSNVTLSVFLQHFFYLWFWLNVTKIKYKNDHNSKTKNRTKKNSCTEKLRSEQCASFL